MIVQLKISLKFQSIDEIKYKSIWTGVTCNAPIGFFASDVLNFGSISISFAIEIQYIDQNSLTMERARMKKEKFKKKISTHVTKPHREEN